MPNSSDDIAKRNAAAWDRLARSGAKLASAARDEDFANPLQTVDPLGWLGGDIAGRQVLCLAAGGGRQSALYAAAGANVTVLDISPEMLKLDRQVAAECGYRVRVVEGSMDDLSMFARGEFDLVIQPVSSCYLPDVCAIYAEVARVVRPGGLYVSQHKSPVSLQAGYQRNAHGNYELLESYYRAPENNASANEPLPPVEPSGPAKRLREQGTTEFLHRWEQLLGGLCRAGFAIEDLIEPLHADPAAELGTFADRANIIAPYVRIKARRAGGGEAKKLVVTE